MDLIAIASVRIANSLREVTERLAMRLPLPFAARADARATFNP
jgi:hypothetical protein